MNRSIEQQAYLVKILQRDYWDAWFVGDEFRAVLLQFVLAEARSKLHELRKASQPT